MCRVLLQDCSSVVQVRNIHSKNGCWHINSTANNSIVLALDALAPSSCNQNVVLARKILQAVYSNRKLNAQTVKSTFDMSHEGSFLTFKDAQRMHTLPHPCYHEAMTHVQNMPKPNDSKLYRKNHNKLSR